MWIDSHAHLDFPDFRERLDAVVEQARQAGVEGIMTIGTVGHEPGVWQRVSQIIERFDGVYAALGVHPHDASKFDSRLAQEIESCMQHPKVLAWGEIGLDYHYDFAPKDVQIEAFRKQIRLAQRVAKPIVIHSREAEEDTARILEEEYAGSSQPPGVLHCFSSGQELADRGLALGFHLGFGGMLTFRKAESIRSTAAAAPLDRLLVETDSPYLAPVPHRGKVNQPAFAALVGEKLAEVRGITPQEAAAATSSNFERLFLRRQS